MRAGLLFVVLWGVAATMAGQNTPPQPPPGAFHPPAPGATRSPGARPALTAAENPAPPALPFEEWKFNPRERTARGIAAWKSENPAAAVEALDTAARLKPGDPLAAYNSGTAHLGAGLADAEPILERALRELPGELATDAHYNLGNARLAAQNAAGAIDSFKETLRRAPGHPGARRNLELALRLLEEQQQQEQQKPQGGSSGQDQQQPPQDPERKPDEGENGDGQGQPDENDEGEGEKPPEGSPEQQPGSGGPRDRPLPQFQDQQDMTAEQAAAILQAVDNLERENRRDDAKKRALAKSTVEKDW